MLVGCKAKEAAELMAGRLAVSFILIIGSVPIAPFYRALTECLRLNVIRAKPLQYTIADLV